MRIGIVCYPTYGGSGVIATELGMALAQKGHQVHFITYSQPVRLNFFSKNIFYHEVSVSDYPLFEYTPYELVLSSKMVDVVKHEKLDLLHVHYAIPHASAAYMAKQILASEGINLPVVTTLHGTDITLVGKDPSFEPVITFAINQSDAVTAVSKSLKEDTCKHFKINNNIQVVPNFIDFKMYSEIKPNGLRKEYTPNNERLIVHVSNFRKVKRVDDVVRVFAKIRKQMPAKLLLIGDGPERYKVEQLCRDLGVCADIKFVGKLKEVEKLLCLADLFILPSESESFGLAALEAMALKVPVISTNTGGLPEVNENGYSGFLSSVGNINEMAENAISILETDESLNQFKDNAFKQAQKFDLTNILPEYEKIYDSLFSDKFS